MTDTAPADAATRPPLPRRWRRAGLLQWLYAFVFVTFVVLFKAGSDHWAWATVLAYGPRWPWLLPGAVIVLGALLCRRRPWLALLVTLIAGTWLLDLHAPMPRFVRASDVRLRVMTLNAAGGSVGGPGTDLSRIEALISDIKPDVVFLQEWRESDPPPLPSRDWNVRRVRSLMICTRLPIDLVAVLPPSELLRESHVLGCRVQVRPGQLVWLFTPHLETPRRAFTHLLAGKPDAFELTEQLTSRRQTVSDRAVAWIKNLAGDSDVLIGGDFNLVSDGRIFRTTWGKWFADAFTTSGWGAGGTKLQDGWRPRIDHVLTGTRWRSTRCVVERDVGSDHLPLVADVERIGPQE